MVSHHLTKFGGHCSSVNGYVTYSVWQVTSQDHVIEGSCGFMGGSSSLYVTSLPGFVVIDIVVAEICFIIIS